MAKQTVLANAKSTTRLFKPLLLSWRSSFKHFKTAHKASVVQMEAQAMMEMMAQTAVEMVVQTAMEMVTQTAMMMVTQTAVEMVTKMEMDVITVDQMATLNFSTQVPLQQNKRQMLSTMTTFVASKTIKTQN
jgi:hypothetical protein